jgi:hypothetical protein
MIKIMHISKSIGFWVIFLWMIASAQEIILSSEISRMPLGCRIVAMGDAGVALPLNVSSVYWNPASISFLPRYEFWLEGAKLYGGLSSQAMAAFGAPIQDGMNAAILYSPFFPGSIERYDTLPGTPRARLDDESLRANGEPVGIFHNNQHLLLVSIAKKFPIPVIIPGGVNLPFPLDLSVGLNAKGVWQTLDPDGKVRMAMNINLDGGVLVSMGIDYDLVKNMVIRQVCIGVAIRNIVPTRMQWLNSHTTNEKGEDVQYSEPVYNSQYFGLSYIDDAGFKWLSWKAALAMQREYLGKNVSVDSLGRVSESGGGYSNSYHYGIELSMWNVVDIRGGLSDKIPVLGAGVHYKNCYIDYSFRFDEMRYSPLRVAFGLMF